MILSVPQEFELKLCFVRMQPEFTGLPGETLLFSGTDLLSRTVTLLPQDVDGYFKLMTISLESKDANPLRRARHPRKPAGRRPIAPR